MNQVIFWCLHMKWIAVQKWLTASTGTNGNLMELCLVNIAGGVKLPSQVLLLFLYHVNMIMPIFSIEKNWHYHVAKSDGHVFRNNQDVFDVMLCLTGLITLGNVQHWWFVQVLAAFKQVLAGFSSFSRSLSLTSKSLFLKRLNQNSQVFCDGECSP